MTLHDNLLDNKGYYLKVGGFCSVCTSASFHNARKLKIKTLLQITFFWPPPSIRELEQTTAITATRTLPNKTFNEQDNSCTLIHFCVVLCKTRMCNNQVLRTMRNASNDGRCHI